MTKKENMVIRRKFEAGIIRSAFTPNPKIFYVRSPGECVITGVPFMHSVFLPHPDITLKEFFSSVS